MKFKGAILLGTALTAALLLGGCGESEVPESPSPEAESLEPSPIVTPEVQYEEVLIGTAVDIDSHLNVRATPGSTGEVIGKAKNGDKFTVLEPNVDGGDWHRISYEGVVAYVSANYVVVERMQIEVVPTASPDWYEPPTADPDDPENPDLHDDGDLE